MKNNFGLILLSLVLLVSCAASTSSQVVKENLNISVEFFSAPSDPRVVASTGFRVWDKELGVACYQYGNTWVALSCVDIGKRGQ